ncbi:SWR1-complex protein 4 [Ceratocystis lukuohia]|uniref:SWR1-complex protein 4 n=1 Tax=Ceratocystis lukuohia TaxID=2019550 RepID=A0ABR4MGU1_9PEZI
MASSDLRDVLNLPAESHTNSARIGKKGRPYGPRSNLKGLAREVQSLGGDTPIAIVQQQLAFKRKRFASRKPAAKWEKRPFTNSARDDPTLVLKHWKRKDALTLGPHGEELPPCEAEDSIFAKYNAKVHIPQYTDEQYHTHLHHENWSKEETDYLLQLISDFDLRWPLIWDRYDYAPRATDGEVSPDEESKAIVPASMARTMEDLKTRYYEVAAKIMASEKPVQYMTQSEKTLYEIMLNYNPTQERIRKEFVANSLSRSKEEAREEELLLVEIKRVLGRNERFNEERRELYQRLDYPKADQHDITSLKTSAGLQNLLQTLMSTDKTKKRKSLVGPGEGIAAPGSAISGSSVAAGSAANASGTASTSAATASTPVQEQTPINQEAASSPLHSSTIVTIPAPAASSATVVATPTSAHHTSGHSRRESMTVATPMSATAKKGAHPLLERKKLSEQEMAIYGVSHHDRLNSGASFRTERTNKLFASKSNQQQIRITNVLTELEIPPRLTMPTANVSIAFEKLLHSVNGLLDCRKVTDKLEAEIKLEMAKKAELEKAIAATDAVATSGGGEGGDEGEAPSTDNAPRTASDAEQGHSGKNENDAMDMTSAEESETDEERESRSTSEGDGQHKRSASVFSSTSDKATKRQRK